TTASVVLLTCFIVGPGSRSKGQASNRDAAAPPTNVNVVNEPNVHVTNTPTVNLAQGTTVQIGNLASNPIPIRSVIVPINRSITIGQGEQPILAVPPGKRFIIEYASGKTERDTPSVSIKAIAGGQVGSFPIAGSQVVRIYADPNTQVV